VVVVLSGMAYSALEVLVPVGDLLIAQNVMVEEEQHDWCGMVGQEEQGVVLVLMELHLSV
jgi:hypothetical protein